MVNRAELAAHFERIETVIDHTEQLVERVETLLGHVAALGVRLEAVDRLHGHQLAEIADALHCPPEAGGGKASAVVEAVGRMETLLKDVLDTLRNKE